MKYTHVVFCLYINCNRTLSARHWLTFESTIAQYPSLTTFCEKHFDRDGVVNRGEIVVCSSTSLPVASPFCEAERTVAKQKVIHNPLPNVPTEIEVPEAGVKLIF